MSKKLIQSWQESYMFNRVVNCAVKEKCAKPFSEQFYSKLTKVMAEKQIGEILKTSVTVGYCYYYATLLCLAMENSELKIGVLENLNVNVNDCYYTEFVHAWVEKDGFVFDTTSKHVFNKEFYYKNYGAKVDKTITHNDLKDKSKLFELGVFAVKDRPEKVDEMFKTFEILNTTLSGEQLEQALKCVYDEKVKKHILENVGLFNKTK